MKNLLIFFIGLFSLSILLNCTSEVDLSKKDFELNQESKIRVQKVLEISSSQDKRLAYGILTKEEKFFLWNDKFKSLVNENKLYQADLILNEGQKSLIIDLQKNLSLNFFDKEQNGTRENFNDDYVPLFIEKARKLFTIDEIGLIFYEISITLPENFQSTNKTVTIKDILNSLNSKSSVTFSRANCNCDPDAFFSCHWGQHDEYCKLVDNCDPVQLDCGFLWLSECTGICLTDVTF